jgi:hypothetical protein
MLQKGKFQEASRHYSWLESSLGRGSWKDIQWCWLPNYFEPFDDLLKRLLSIGLGFEKTQKIQITRIMSTCCVFVSPRCMHTRMFTTTFSFMPLHKQS